MEKAKRCRVRSSTRLAAVAALGLSACPFGSIGAGSSAPFDAGDAAGSSSADAGSADSGRPGSDAGGAVLDAGETGFDAGASLDAAAADAGTGGAIDSGPSVDAGPGVDAGSSSRLDAGRPDGTAAADAGTSPAPSGHFQMEDLGRGAVAVKVPNGVYLGWRMLGYEYSADGHPAVSYNVYRDGVRVANVADSTNFMDAAGSGQSLYAVSAVVNGVEQPRSSPVGVWAQNHLRIPIEIPPPGKTKSACPTPGEVYSYSANDGSAGDLDGDGEYEIVLKWDPSNSKDNARSGCTGNVTLDAYKLNGERLWRIDLGINIRAGAHYSQFVVYDFDGDGKAEVAVKTAPGTRDGTGAFLHTGPAAADDDAADHRNSSGYVLAGPEYLTVFSGPTGAELATASFDVPRGAVSSWGDNYGNRVDRFLASAGFVSDLGQGKLRADGLQPAASPELRHRERHGGPAGARHPPGRARRRGTVIPGARLCIALRARALPAARCAFLPVERDCATPCCSATATAALQFRLLRRAGRIVGHPESIACASGQASRTARTWSEAGSRRCSSMTSACGRRPSRGARHPAHHGQ